MTVTVLSNCSGIGKLSPLFDLPNYLKYKTNFPLRQLPKSLLMLLLLLIRLFIYDHHLYNFLRYFNLSRLEKRVPFIPNVSNSFIIFSLSEKKQSSLDLL
jgi:hypothetical protein